LVPLAFSVLVTGQHDYLAFTLFAVASLSDFVDGQIARRTNTVTSVGQAMDPLVDRFLIAAGVIGLYTVGRLPLWILLLLIGRDVILLIGLALVKRFGGGTVRVVFIGKLTTTLLLVGFSGLIANIPRVSGLGWTHSLLLPGLNSGRAAIWIWFVYLGIMCSMLTFLCYVVMGIRALQHPKDSDE
jgi:cardiolipin synthase